MMTFLWYKKASKKKLSLKNKENDFIDYLRFLINNPENRQEDIITEIEKQFLLDNKDFEDELEEIKHEVKSTETDIRELK